jgi:hypothetical protein
METPSGIEVGEFGTMTNKKEYLSSILIFIIFGFQTIPHD